MPSPHSPDGFISKDPIPTAERSLYPYPDAVSDNKKTTFLMAFIPTIVTVVTLILLAIVVFRYFPAWSRREARRRGECDDEEAAFAFSEQFDMGNVASSKPAPTRRAVDSEQFMLSIVASKPAPVRRVVDSMLFFERGVFEDAEADAGRVRLDSLRRTRGNEDDEDDPDDPVRYPKWI